MENWLKVKGFEGLYEVSDLGRVRSLDRNIKQLNNGTECIRFYKGKLLTLKKEKNGYFTVHLRNREISKHLKVHRLVAQAFIDNPKQKPLVNHKNGVKVDNRASNLEWCTAKENSQHALNNNLHNPVITDNARKSSVDKCSKETICLETEQIFKSAYEAAIWLNDFKFNNTKKVQTVSARIRNCRNGSRKTAYGYHFKFNK